jgi:hypothetical protein
MPRGAAKGEQLRHRGEGAAEIIGQSNNPLGLKAGCRRVFPNGKDEHLWGWECGIPILDWIAFSTRARFDYPGALLK